MRKTGTSCLITCAAVAAVLTSPLLEAATTVSSIDFKAGENANVLEIEADGPLSYETQENTADNQIIIDLKDAKLGPRAKRKLDTSSFNGLVNLVSPYQVQGEGDRARIVIQLREQVKADVSQDGNFLKVTVPNTPSQSAASEDAPPDSAPPEEGPPLEPPPGEADASASATPAPAMDVAQANAGAASANPAGTEVKRASNDPLDEFVQSRQAKRFTGRPITLQVRDADLNDVLRLISEASGFNIIVGEGVGGKITLSLVDVPWDQALEVILNTKRLGAERSNNILRIMTLANLTAEKKEILEAKDMQEKSAPRITRVFPISYADAPSLKEILTNFGKGGASTTPGQGTSVLIDQRTNSLIVQDIPENIERMRKLIQLLDTQTPQVLVEAKVVEASENFAKSISGAIGGAFEPDNYKAGAVFNGSGTDLANDTLLGNVGGDADRNGKTAGGGRFNFNTKLAFLPGAARLNAVLNLNESENQVKVIASPKTVVMNKKSSKILQGTPVLVQATAQSTNGTMTQYISQQANLSLDVTPTVTNSGAVLMTLKISRDVPQTVGVAPRNLDTEVLVESGSTLVIGGIYTMQTEDVQSGFPYLRKIPILGWLFGTESHTNQRSELFIFITPRVINEEESGIST